MIDPGQFDRMIEWAFAIATFIYTIIGVTGYIMFGTEVSDEASNPSTPSESCSKVADNELQFSQDLMTTPGFNMNLNKIALWGLVIAPLSKFALSTRPVSFLRKIRAKSHMLTQHPA